MPIKNIFARQIFDSRGNPTLEVDLVTELGLFRASVPSGATISVHEAQELRDKIPTDYRGLSVFNAVKNVNTIIAPELIKTNIEVTQQRELDSFLKSLDGTEDKSMLGSNAILGVSIAACKAGAAKRGMPLYRHIADLTGNGNLYLPVPIFNVINGGNRSSNKLAMQEFLIMPTGAQSFAEAMKMGTDAFHFLKDIIEEKYGLDSTAVGYEGGFSPEIQDNKDAIQLIIEAIKRAGYAGKVDIALDMAASVFFKNGTYDLDFKNPTSNPADYLTADKLINMYLDLVKEYSVISIEDPFEQDDWPSWAQLVNKTPIQIVGDDLTVTNPNRINIAIDRRACNCILLKINQIGTVTELLDAQKTARTSGMGIIMAQRAGETEDTFLADVSVGLSTGQVKFGAPCRSERLAKYNQILRIEEELGSYARYAGKNFRNPV